MLDELHVRDLALIAEATVMPHEGLTVLTGETGAGKSALLGALKLLMGGKASADQVRDGAREALVEARLVTEGQEDIIAVRRVTSEGRSRCSIDGSMATIPALAATVGSTMDLCGQHDQQMLLKPANHRDYLDAWGAGEIVGPLTAYKLAWEDQHAAASELEELRKATESSQSRIEEARFLIGRFDEVAPKPGEYEELQQSLPRLEHAESLLSAAHESHGILGDEDGALDMLNSALVAIGTAAKIDPELERIRSVLQEAIFPVEDAVRDLRRYADDLDFDSGAYQRAQDRMGELVGLMRMFGPTMEDVLTKADEARDLLHTVDDSQELLAKANAKLDAAEKTLLAAGDTLHKVHQLQAPLFAGAVRAQMGRLEMGTAELVVDVRKLPRAKWGPQGPDEVEYLYRPAEGLAARPFTKIASGGEVSRVMLSIKVVLGEVDPCSTLVFDEVDAGIGGSTARAVAAVLADLARTHQVIVVTHLATVAVVADRHYVVSKKETANGVPQTTIDLVESEARVAEVARLLSGDASLASMDHARQMLAEAHPVS